MKRVLAKWMPAFLRRAPALLRDCMKPVTTARFEPVSGIRVVMAASGAVRIPHLPVLDFKKMTCEKLKQEILERLDFQYDAWRVAVFVGKTQMLDYQSLKRLGVRSGDEVGIMLLPLNTKTVFSGITHMYGHRPSVPTRVRKFSSFYNHVVNRYIQIERFSSELCLSREVADRIGFFETQRWNGTWRRFHCPFIAADGEMHDVFVPTHMWQRLGKSLREWDRCAKHLMFLKSLPPLEHPLRVFWKDTLQREEINPQLFFRTMRYNVDPGRYEREMRRPIGGKQREEKPEKRKELESNMRKEHLWSLTAARNSLRGSY